MRIFHYTPMDEVPAVWTLLDRVAQWPWERAPGVRFPAARNDSIAITHPRFSP